MKNRMPKRSASLVAIVTIAIAGSGFVLPSLLAAPPKNNTKKTIKLLAAAVPATQTIAGDNTPLTEEQKIVHVLNRLGYGARPGDVERVRSAGLNAYIEQQLHPEQIADSGLTAKLAGLSVLQMPASELVQNYYEGQRANKELQQAAQRALLAKQSAAMPNGKPATMPSGEPATMKEGDATMMDTDASKTDAASPNKREQKREALQSLTPEQQEKYRQLMLQNAGKKGAAQGMVQLTMAKIVRAVESEKQLNEVMADFWSNHFNIDMRKGQCRVYKIADDRDTIRPHMWGRFRDLLGASAKSPAMLFYLDNASSSVAREVKLNSRQQARLAQNPALKKIVQRAQGGVNENYAREIMELHTLGVDGGYTQKDVQEVARCLTGWTIARNQGEFQFDARRHDDGEKIVLGQTIPAGGGQQDGEKVLDILASNPATIRHITFQLCQKLVADVPPASVQNKAIATWKRTDGDLREIIRTIVTSPEFFSRAAYRQKLKSPFEYAVSSVRALGGTIQMPNGDEKASLAMFKPGATPRNNNFQTALAGQIGTMGEPLFQCQPPTGYTVDSRKWVSTGALIARLNFALRLTNSQMPGVNLTMAHEIVPTNLDAAQSVNKLGDALLQGELTPPTRATLLKEVKASETSGEKVGTRRVAALLLGSPEFQRR